MLDPLAEGRDELQGKHANTQFPKIIGCERIHELTGGASEGANKALVWSNVRVAAQIAKALAERLGTSRMTGR